MDDTFNIALVFIALSALVATFIRRVKRDKCLKDFAGDLINLDKTDGKTIWGTLRVENTGLELIYQSIYDDADGHKEASYLLYKYEYPNIQSMIRFHDELTENGKKEREKELERTYRPKFSRRLKRKIANVFRTVRDSFAEVLNLLINKAKKTTALGGTITGQDKYVSQMKQELMGSVGTSYEPLLERYIGHKIILELIRGEEIFEYSGVLKEYTAEFIEIMDVNYKITGKELLRKADIIALRKYAVVRHPGE